jgi:hypothetical protein
MIQGGIKGRQMSVSLGAPLTTTGNESKTEAEKFELVGNVCFKKFQKMKKGLACSSMTQTHFFTNVCFTNMACINTFNM